MNTDDIRSHDSAIILYFYTIMITTCSEKGTEMHVVIFGCKPERLTNRSTRERSNFTITFQENGLL